MTRAIGFRTSPSTVYYAIVELLADGDMKVISLDQVNIPKCLPLPEQLKHIRNNILDILSEYDIFHAGVRTTEPFAPSINITRVSIEAVIQELFASSCLRSFYVGSIATISKRNGFPTPDFKKYVSNEKEFTRIDKFNDYSKEIKEALLTAIGAFDVN